MGQPHTFYARVIQKGRLWYRVRIESGHGLPIIGWYVPGYRWACWKGRRELVRYIRKQQMRKSDTIIELDGNDD